MKEKIEKYSDIHTHILTFWSVLLNTFPKGPPLLMKLISPSLVQASLLRQREFGAENIKICLKQAKFDALEFSTYLLFYQVFQVSNWQIAHQLAHLLVKPKPRKGPTRPSKQRISSKKLDKNSMILPKNTCTFTKLNKYNFFGRYLFKEF